MAYEFGRVDLRVFDFHVSLGALVAADSLKAPMTFLSAPDLYRKQFQQPPFTSGDFRFRPLRGKSRLYHHFWKYYTSSFGKLDPWRLLAPFVCEPASKNNKLLIKSPGPGVGAFARPVTYLFPFGWSNIIEISLQGKMTPAIVQQFAGTLRTSHTGPFEMNGKSLGLSDVFSEYSKQLMTVCFVQGAAAADFRRVNRNITMSISRFTGEVAPYKSWDGTEATMSAAEKATLHSMLLGEDVSMEQVVAVENGKGASKDKFLLTRYRGAGFAVTYFDRGTLLFLQDVAKDSKKTNLLRCFASNINLCLMMARSLLSFYNYPDTQSAGDKTLLGQTRDIAKKQLLAIPARYTNPLCQTWFQYYDPWQKLKPVEKQDK